MRHLFPIGLLFLLSCQNKPVKTEEVEAPSKAEQTPPKEENVSVLLEKAGLEYAYPHFSKDGGHILFQYNASGTWQLCVLNLADHSIRQLTKDSSNNYFADWSSDNSKICFVSDRSGNEEIYLMDNQGKNLRQLTKNKARNIHPYFAPDGKTILFSSTHNSGNLELWEMRTDGGNLKRITDTPDEETCARFSPDKTQILFLRNNANGLDDLFLKDLQTGQETNLTNTPGTDGWPCWMPDGKSIVFSAIENGGYKLFAYRLEDSSLTRLSNPVYPAEDCRAHVSPDGRRIVFNRQKDERRRTNALMLLRLSE